MSNFFTLPGEYVLKQLGLHASGMASLLGVTEPADAIAFTIVLSVFIWILACVALWGSVRLVQNLRRVTNALLHTFWYRITEAAGNLKTRAICKFRQLFPRWQSADQEAMPEMHFDDFDFTVLRAAADCSPGFTTAAPELASQYGLRPAQFLESLRKLHRSRMITTVIGSTDGFDNYRLTDHGAAYMEMWQRRQAS